MNFFRTVFATCSHFRNYRAFRDVPASTSLKYVIKLVALLSLVGVLTLIPVAQEMVDTFTYWVDKHLPTFTIKDGHVTSPVAQPYRVGDRDFLFILDATGTAMQIDTNALQGLFVGADSFLFWIQNTNAPKAVVHSQRQSLRGFPDGVVNGEYFRRLIHAFAWVAFPLGFIVITLVALFTTLVQAYLFALVASLMERGNAHALRLAQLLNIALHAVTPAAIVYTVYQALHLKSVDLWLVYLLVYGVFVVGAASACRDKLPAEEREEDGLL